MKSANSGKEFVEKLNENLLIFLNIKYIQFAL